MALAGRGLMTSFSFGVQVRNDIIRRYGIRAPSPTVARFAFAKTATNTSKAAETFTFTVPLATVLGESANVTAECSDRFSTNMSPAPLVRAVLPEDVICSILLRHSLEV